MTGQLQQEEGKAESSRKPSPITVQAIVVVIIVMMCCLCGTTAANRPIVHPPYDT
jgi:hypothetical protein